MGLMSIPFLPLLGCFYCGVDSKPLLLVLIGIIGSLGLATLFLGVGLFMRGRFQNSENIKNDIFIAEDKE